MGKYCLVKSYSCVSTRRQIYLWVKRKRLRQLEGCWIVFVELAELLTLKPTEAKHCSNTDILHNLAHHRRVTQYDGTTSYRHNPNNANYALFSSHSREELVCASVTHQADELPVEPTEHVRPLLRLGSEDT